MTKSVKVHCSFDEMVPLSELKPNPKNPNTHSKKQTELLAKIFQENGVRRSITVSKRSGLMTVGHGRLLAAEIAGMDSYPVDFQDYDSPEHEMADMLADNRIPELADMNFQMLEADKQELELAGFDLEVAGFEETEDEEGDSTGGEVDIDNLSDEMKLTFKMDEDTYEKVVDALKKYDDDLNTAFLLVMNV